jgi:hypothetical protein
MVLLSEAESELSMWQRTTLSTMMLCRVDMVELRARLVQRLALCHYHPVLANIETLGHTTASGCPPV